MGSELNPGNPDMDPFFFLAQLRIGCRPRSTVWVRLIKYNNCKYSLNINIIYNNIVCIILALSFGGGEPTAHQTEGLDASKVSPCQPHLFRVTFVPTDLQWSCFNTMLSVTLHNVCLSSHLHLAPSNSNPTTSLIRTLTGIIGIIISEA